MKTPPFLTPTLLFFGAFVVSWIYQTPPSLGDDLNYWGLAMDLHRGTPGAWSEESFHDLRWPVWGLCWLLQIPFGFSALSYYLQPMVYLGAGAVLVHAMTREIGASRSIALLAGILFLFHPQLDSVIDRPMPDLSEGFWVALAFFGWLRLMRSENAGGSVGFAVLVGLCLAIGQANRITGVFAIPVLVLCTLAFHPKRILWLALVGLFAAFFVAVEFAVYYSITGEWLHSIQANLGATGRKGTETLPVWQLPFRFLPAFYRRYSDVIYIVATIIGVYPAVRWFGRPGRALVAYALLYLLTYSCALQSFSPPRPLVRDGDRFLASLAFPLSTLAAFGLGLVIDQLRRRLDPYDRWPLHRLLPLGFLALVIGLIFFATRPFRESNYLSTISEYLVTVPEGTKVLANPALQHVVTMADPQKAETFDWTLKKDLLNPGTETLRVADRADQIWFIRKWIWTGTRKKSEYDRLSGIGDIAPYLRPPLGEWTAVRSIPKGDVPDFVFLDRRTDGTALTSLAPDGQLLRELFVPQLKVPSAWALPHRRTEPTEYSPVPIPPALRGQVLFLGLRYSSDETEPVRVNVYFYRDGDRFHELTLKPYLFPDPSEDFFFLTIPPDADALSLRLRISPEARRFTLDRFDLLREESPSANLPTDKP
ncbi:MAG: hypothetical protein WA771_07280 [Chthoniobacterales bacterium]